MGRFSDEVAAQLLADCKRHCCICLRWRGRRLEIHHIVPVSKDGPGTAENGIPVCFDCHAEIESQSNMGRRFTEEELRQHRDSWFQTVKTHPEVLLQESSQRSGIGPLEALLGELDFNLRVVSDKPDVGYPPLENGQFRRAMAMNALSALPDDARAAVHEAYRTIAMVNYHFDVLLNLRAASSDHGATVKVRNQLRDLLRDQLIPSAMTQLRDALGQGGRSAGPELVVHSVAP